MADNETWLRLHREALRHDLLDQALFEAGAIAVLVVLHVVGLHLWLAGGMTSRAWLWLAQAWGLLVILVPLFLWSVLASLWRLPRYLRSRDHLETRVFGGREVPVVDSLHAFVHFARHGAPAAWKLDVSRWAFSKGKLAAKSQLLCAACAAPWTDASERQGACAACRARGAGLLAVFVPKG